MSAISIQSEADREGHLLDQYRAAEGAFLAILDRLQRQTAFTNVDELMGDVRSAISDHSPLNVWERTIDEWRVDAEGRR